jgi:hypothetical protein
VEAGLTGLLVLAEVNSSQAVLATLTYLIASYWVPLCAGRSLTACSASAIEATAHRRKPAWQRI